MGSTLTREEKVALARKEETSDRVRRMQAAEKEELTAILLQALATGPDAVYAVQRACGHDLVRLGLMAEDLRVVSSGGEIADRIVELLPPDQVIDPHETDSLTLLQIVHQRLVEERSIVQAERVELMRLMTQILRRLGQMIGR